MQKVVCLFLGLLTIAAMPPAEAAKRLGPPVEELLSAPERVRIVVAEATDKPQAGRILFSINEQLSGEAPDEVLLRTDEQTFDDVAVGRSYVVAWTSQRRSMRARGGWEEDPEGPSTVQTAGLGATAVFEDSQEIRFLFAPGTISEPATANEQIDALLAQMQRPDFRSRGLVITELYLRDDLTAAMGKAQVEILKQVVQNEGVGPQHQDFLLRTALNLPPDQDAPWLAEQLRKVIIQNGTQYDLASFVPGLVRTAARGLRQVGEAPDVGLLSLLLYSNNPGVSKAALAAMDQLDHQAAVAKAQQALGRTWIHSETRLALQRYLVSSPSQTKLRKKPGFRNFCNIVYTWYSLVESVPCECSSASGSAAQAMLTSRTGQEIMGQPSGPIT